MSPEEDLKQRNLEKALFERNQNNTLIVNIGVDYLTLKKIPCIFLFKTYVPLHNNTSAFFADRGQTPLLVGNFRKFFDVLQ